MPSMKNPLCRSKSNLRKATESFRNPLEIFLEENFVWIQKQRHKSTKINLLIGTAEFLLAQAIFIVGAFNKEHEYLWVKKIIGYNTC